MARKFSGRSEHTEQAILMTRVAMEFPGLLIFAVANGGKRDKRTAARLKEEGVVAGIPDVYVEEARGMYFGLRIELKKVSHRRSINGGMSDEQIKIRDKLTQGGYLCLLCHGADDAMARIRWYMGLPRTFGIAAPA